MSGIIHNTTCRRSYVNCSGNCSGNNTTTPLLWAAYQHSLVILLRSYDFCDNKNSLNCDLNNKTHFARIF